MPFIDLHNHTLFSYDGSNTPEEIIENAILHKVDYIGITDHQFSLNGRLEEYYERVQECKRKYEGQINVLCGLEIGTRPAPNDLLASSCEKFDYVLFECLDDGRAMDLYEFFEWRRLFKCKVGLAHTDIFRLSEEYDIDMIREMKRADIFWELNTSGHYDYYYDFISNDRKRELIKKSRIEMTVGSDTHWIGEYRYSLLKAANELLEELGNPLP